MIVGLSPDLLTNIDSVGLVDSGNVEVEEVTLLNTDVTVLNLLGSDSVETVEEINSLGTRIIALCAPNSPIESSTHLRSEQCKRLLSDVCGLETVTLGDVATPNGLIDAVWRELFVHRTEIGVERTRRDSHVVFIHTSLRVWTEFHTTGEFADCFRITDTGAKSHVSQEVLQCHKRHTKKLLAKFGSTGRKFGQFLLSDNNFTHSRLV